MEIVLCLIIPIVAGITLAAAVMGYKMGKGETRVIASPKVKPRETDEERKRAIIAGNIERYDGTAAGQQEVR